MNTGPALLFVREAYDTSGKKLLGRQAAGEGFLRGLARYGSGDPLYCCTEKHSDFEDFSRRVAQIKGSQRKVDWVRYRDHNHLSRVGLLYRPDPAIGEHAWHRYRTVADKYSLCGVTHTVASREIMARLGDLLIAPVRSTDAVICTSRAVKTVVERVLESWAEYLGTRTGARPRLELQLPVIPLGTDCDAFSGGDAVAERRRSLREQLGIEPADVAILFVGRLIFFAKAHPVPMYLAVEEAARRTGAKVHLIQAGWFEQSAHEEEFRRTVALFAPSVHSVILDGRRPDVRSDVWHAADIFTSLSDNVQETFGLTPIEAMAAGLPVVVSDYNGYKESVRDGVDGFRIPTVTPEPGSALDLAVAFEDGRLNYSSFVGLTAMYTAVDIESCAQALTSLIASRDLRLRMGDAGRSRARAVYDWKVVIPQYEALWAELAERRAILARGTPALQVPQTNPLCDDPTRIYAHYPTRCLADDDAVELGERAAAEDLLRLSENLSTEFGRAWRDPTGRTEALLAAIRQEGAVTVAALMKGFGGPRTIDTVRLRRNLAYLLKFGVLRLSSGHQ